MLWADNFINTFINLYLQIWDINGMDLISRYAVARVVCTFYVTVSWSSFSINDLNFLMQNTLETPFWRGNTAANSFKPETGSLPEIKINLHKKRKNITVDIATRPQSSLNPPRACHSVASGKSKSTRVLNSTLPLCWKECWCRRHICYRIKLINEHQGWVLCTQKECN